MLLMLHDTFQIRATHCFNAFLTVIPKALIVNMLLFASSFNVLVDNIDAAWSDP